LRTAPLKRREHSFTVGTVENLNTLEKPPNGERKKEGKRITPRTKGEIERILRENPPWTEKESHIPSDQRGD